MKPDARGRIERVIAAFDAQGWHRTGTEVDHASGEWLAGVLQDAGAESRLETYPFRRLEPGECAITVGDTRIVGMPAFDGGLTDRKGVHARLGPLGSDAEIGVVVVSAGGRAPELERARREGSHSAIVTVTVAGQPGLAPRNATAFATTPGGPPVLQVGSQHREILESATNRGDTASVFVQGSWHEGSASNVVAEVPGLSPGLTPLVVMTPRSGWWECASERGGGIAVLVEVARALAAAPAQRPVLFLATTGHELGHWGLERFLGIRPHLASEVPLWLHLGASIGAALSPMPGMFCSCDANELLAGQAFARAGITGLAHAPRGTVPGGESKNIHERGGSYISLAGGSAVFHLEADRWPEAVNVDSVAAYAVAIEEIVRQYAPDR